MLHSMAIVWEDCVWVWLQRTTCFWLFCNLNLYLWVHTNMICRSLEYVLQKQSVNKANKSPYFRNHTQITILGFCISKRCPSVDEWISKQCVEETIETLLPCVGQKYFKSSRAKNVHLCVSHYNQTKRYNNFIPFHYIQFFGKKGIKLYSLILTSNCSNLLH